jgi:hypothetical protein
MLFTFGVVIAVIAVVTIPGMRLPRGMNAAALGWMSQQWLAEYRASHPL